MVFLLTIVKVTHKCKIVGIWPIETKNCINLLEQSGTYASVIKAIIGLDLLDAKPLFESMMVYC